MVFLAIYRTLRCGLQTVELFDQLHGDGVAEAGVQVDLPWPRYLRRFEMLRRSAGVLLRRLLRLPDDAVSSNAVVIFLYRL